MVSLNQLADNPGARKDRIRVGRGIGSGKGKTCGRGEKGQKSRSGVSIKGFEGGQMPIFRRLPKRGFTNIHAVPYATVNLLELQRAVDAGKLSSGQSVDRAALVEAGVIRSSDAHVKLLAKGSLSVPLSLTVDKASASAKKAIEDLGGTLTLTQDA